MATSHATSSLTAPSPAAAGLGWALTRLAEAKDPVAWAELLDEAGADIQRLALRIGGDASLAEDALQETLMLVRDHAGRFAPRGDDADTEARRWILGVAANATLQLMRRQQRQRGRDRRAGDHFAQVTPPCTDPGEQAERREEQRLLRRELAALPAVYGQALTLHYLAGQDYAALAGQLQVPIDTVRTRVHRGLKALRARLARCGIALSLAALGGLLGDLGAATVGVTALPATAAGLLTSSAIPTTTFTIATTTIASGGLVMATLVTGTLAATIAVAVSLAGAPGSHAEEQAPTAPTSGQTTERRSTTVSTVTTTNGKRTAATVTVASTGPAAAANTTAAALTRHITFEFADTPSADAFGFVAQVMGTPIRIDADAPAGTITLKVNDMPLSGALTWLTALTGTSWQDGGDHIRITRAATPAQPAPAQQAPVQPADPALDHEITLDFQDTALVDAVGFLQRIGGVNIVLDPGVAAANPAITLRAERMKLRDVLGFVTRLANCTWSYRNQAVFIGAGAPAAPPAPGKPAGKGSNDF